MDSATWSIYLADPRVDRHHLIIQNTRSVFPSSQSHAFLLSIHRSTQFMWLLTHSCQASIDPCNLCGSTRLGIPSYCLTLFLHSSSQNHSFSRIPLGWHVRCSGVLMMGCLPSSSTITPHCDRVNSEIHSEAMINHVWRYRWRPAPSEIGDELGGCDRASLEICTWRPGSCKLGGRNRGRLEIHLVAVIE